MNIFDSDEPIFDDEELGYWLAFEQMNGVGIKRVSALLRNFETMKAVWKANALELSAKEFQGLIGRELANSIVAQREKAEPEKLLAACRDKGIAVIPHHHPEYPPLLREIHDPPMILFMRGNLKPVDLQAAVAIVGTRKPTTYGKGLSRELAKDLASQGVTIVSGMAYGIDSLAHWGALDAGGRTVAVLGCGPDVCYPPTNRNLYDKIVLEGQGCVLSEFFPGTQPETWRFPARNRIISGLSKGTIVIEADETSGSLITADLAFQQNRQVFSIPGRIDSRMSRGTNFLIKANKAMLITSHEDVMKELGWTPSPRGAEIPVVVELFGREKEILEMVSLEPVHFDHLCHKSGMSPGELSATLTMLELAGVVARQPGDWYARLGSATIIPGDMP